MATHGNTVIIYRSGNIIGGTTVNEVKSDVDLQEISSSSQSSFKEYKPMRKGWQFTVNYLMLSTSALGVSGGNGIKDILQVGTTYSLYFKTRGASNTNGVGGNAILKTCVINAAVNGLVKGVFTFVGNGTLS